VPLRRMGRDRHMIILFTHIDNPRRNPMDPRGT
jgi:hypothetical protein